MAGPTIADQCAALRGRLGDLRAAADAGDAGRLRAWLDGLTAAADDLCRRADEVEARYRELDRECGFVGELFRLAPDGHLVTDAAGTIRRANRSAARLLGGGDQDLAGRPLEAFAVGGDRAVIAAELDRLRRPAAPGRELVEARARLRSLAGRAFHAGLTAAEAPPDPAGVPALQWAVRDITDRAETEDRLRRSEARLRAVLDTAFNGMITTDEAGVIDSFNRAAERMFGYPEADVVGRPLSDLVPSVQTEGELRSDGRHIVYAVRELTGRRRDGTTFPVELAVSDGRADGRRFFTAVARDLTDRQRAEERAVRAERLAAIGQMVAGLAHESRNALQRSQAALERLGARVGDRPDAAALLAELQQAQDHLHRLFEEVRTYAAPVRLDLRDCHLADAWRAAWASLAALRADRHAELREESDVAASACVADPFRLEQVFRNVFANALEAAPGPVRVTVRCGPAAVRGEPAVRVAVCDDGPGFTPAQRQNVFEPFYTTKTRGTGLGMAIVRRIVEAHGGEIEVGDRDCPGAEIVITLPRGSP